MNCKQLLFCSGLYLYSNSINCQPIIPEPYTNPPLYKAPDILPPLTQELPSNHSCGGPIDIMFMFDTTASMEFQIESAKKDGESLLRTLAKELPNTRFAISKVEDKPEWGGSPSDIAYAMLSDFTTDIGKTTATINNLTLGAGGDSPEAFPYALRMASNEKSWRSDAHRIVVLIADNESRSSSQLEEAIQDANYSLIVLSTARYFDYWKKFNPNVSTIGSNESFAESIIESIRRFCHYS